MINSYFLRTCCILLFVSALSSCQNSSSLNTENSEDHKSSGASNTKPFTSADNEPHQYGGWYCPDNFGFVPVDIQKLKEVPVVANRLPTKQELKDNMSLIDVDVMKYPDARALKMDLPRAARVYSEQLRKDELVIVIQAIVLQNDTIVGYRFANGGNGSCRIREVSFLSNEEVAAMGSQPFYFSKSVVKASIKDIWRAMGKTDYFKQLAKKFNKKKFFAAEWNSNLRAEFGMNTDNEKAAGFADMVFGNYYMHIDYDRNGFHYSEKLLMIENQMDHSTELFFASGPYPKDFEKQKNNADNWLQAVKIESEAH